MADIYSRAENVIIWLGPGYNDSSLVIKTLNKIALCVEVDLAQVIISPRSGIREDEKVWSNISSWIEDLFDVTALKSLDSFLKRPWFHRLWIWQEARLARTATVICCEERMDWAACIDSMCSLNLHYTADRMRARRIFHIISIGDINRGYNFLDIFYRTQHSNCTDKRDRVYATFGLMNWTDSHLVKIKANYNKTAPEVYKDFALAHYEQLGSMEIMEHCGIQPTKLRAENLIMPSWTPDWSCPLRSHPLPGFCHASGSSCAIASLSECSNDILNVTEISCALVKEAKHLPFCLHGTLFLVDWQKMLTKVVPFDILNNLSSPYLSSGNENLPEAFTRTLAVDNFAENCVYASIKGPRFEVCSDILSRLLHDQAISKDDFEKVQEEIRDSYNIICEVSGGRSVFTTYEGFMGLAPDIVIPGDIISVFLGANKPVLLRPCENGRYQVLGMCYVHGLMNNEALLGPLPGAFRLVPRRGTLLLSQSYFDPESSKFQIDDPRLGSLPSGWRFETLYPNQDEQFDTFQIFVNEETDERTFFDPRLTPDALKVRNSDLKLEIFSLI